ncbi:uncharacterized protein LOC130676885 [Microplitis mediator]|uniref:uncharacterized protein LOC130676885 n=1 Tax=Microplitis mediator TaxID=375433 RepID=UPI00255731D4|nr:uncharacterized protein LOC130676885 [Microplitis mediator]
MYYRHQVFQNAEPTSLSVAIDESAQYYLNMLPPSPIPTPGSETGMDETYVIDGTHISAEDYAKLVQAPTMRKRVNRDVNVLWKPEELATLYMKPDVKNPLKIVVTPEEKKKVKDLSLYIQKKWELNIAKNGNDDIDRFLDKWMGEYFKECRRQAKNNK